ncbi:hypothetical protein CpipJ_CPIJ009196 [Culex quinquefasciatus]|uniref:Uncharacterized protein n=1 Tax=Culex quinquefasciatus TaxID=7176 RepID=B0WQ64_CULQU|nr:hypothetical protein CpipJ_CPIJ009196 [Culex quinquefasciatus]|eukprot:XP_001850848.1 hypothetical protein CpipJ_CPIJ009196 [Culex quinquefasciatus]
MFGDLVSLNGSSIPRSVLDIDIIMTGWAAREENIFTGRSFLHCKSNTSGEEIGSDVALSVLQAIVLNLNLPLETFGNKSSCWYTFLQAAACVQWTSSNTIYALQFVHSTLVGAFCLCSLQVDHMNYTFVVDVQVQVIAS